MGEGDRQDSDSGPQGTRVFRSSDLKEVRQQEAPASDSPGASIRGTSDPFTGQRFTLTTGRISVGRQDDNDITLGIPSVSSVHARFSEQPDGRWKILNVLSTNGTFVNDERVSEKMLEHGDRVRFGEVEFVFEMADRPAAEARSKAGGESAGDENRWIWAAAAGAVILAGLIVWLLL